MRFGKRQTKNKEAVEAPKSQQCFDKLAKLTLIFMIMCSFNQKVSLKNKLIRLPEAECSLKKASKKKHLKARNVMTNKQ